MKVVMTGGHHSSALPIIHCVQAQNLDVQIYWMGHKHSLKNDKNDTLEYKEITALNIPFFELKTGKVYKSLSVKNVVKIVRGLIASYIYLNKVKPDLIVSFGGYLAVPVVIAGWLQKIPIITHEQTTVVGYANRLISLFADKILISWKASAKYFNPDKTVFTGIPLRDSIFESTSQSFNVNNNLPTIFVFAGKTGSVTINGIVREAFPQLLELCNIIHQCGDYSEASDFEKLSSTYSKIEKQVPGKYNVRKFILEDTIGEAYNLADMVVSRAGAHTVSELMALEKPALLIPISWVSHNEQLENAKVVKNSGMGEILLEKDLTVYNLVERVKYMLHNLSNYKLNMALNMREMSANSPQIFLGEILKYAKK
jgi:UDP-N-acetylglucosamine--N-acetylmuramyl-(pentapeptide) pyrophosphoryl-undecaprenol N-acetylglucosamine transferase